MLQGLRIFYPGGARTPAQGTITIIDEHSADYGVEPICRVLPIAASTKYEQVAQRRNPSLLSSHIQIDELLKREVVRVCGEHFGF